MKKINKKGFSLIELMLVLSVIITIMIIAFIMFSKVERQRNISIDVDTMANIISGIDSLYNQSYDYKGLNTQLLFKTGIIPKSKSLVDDNDIKNSFGGTLGVNVNRSNGIYSSYRLSETDVDPDSCYDMANAVYSKFKSRIYEISVYDTSVYTKGIQSFSPKKLISACKAAKSSTDREDRELDIFIDSN